MTHAATPQTTTAQKRDEKIRVNDFVTLVRTSMVRSAKTATSSFTTRLRIVAGTCGYIVTRPYHGWATINAGQQTFYRVRLSDLRTIDKKSVQLTRVRDTKGDRMVITKYLNTSDAPTVSNTTKVSVSSRARPVRPITDPSAIALRQLMPEMEDLAARLRAHARSNNAGLSLKPLEAWALLLALEGMGVIEIDS